MKKAILYFVLMLAVSAALVIFVVPFVLMLTVAFVVAVIIIFLLILKVDRLNLKSRQIHTIIDNSPIPVQVHDTTFEVISCNKAAWHLCGMDSEIEYINNYEKCIPKIQPDGRPSLDAAKDYVKQAMDKGVVTFEWFFQNREGEPIPSEITMMQVELQNSTRLLSFIQDKQFYFKYLETVQMSRQRLHTMIDASPMACILADENLVILDANIEFLKLLEIKNPLKKTEKLYDFAPQIQPDGSFTKEKMQESLNQAIKEGRTAFEIILRALTSEDADIQVKISLARVNLDNNPIILGYITDMRDLKSAFEMVDKFSSLAYADELTGISSRRYFMDNAQKMFDDCMENEYDFSLIYFDIDNFKSINDTFGHGVGDEVLKIVAARTKGTIKKGTMVSRYGGEEFIITLPRVSTANAIKTAKRIRQNIIASCFATYDLCLYITVSFGVASKSAAAPTLSEVIENADKALYHAKNNGKDMVVSYGDIIK